MSGYKPHEIEAKWSQYWKENKTYKTKSPKGKKKNYTLVMFPYPSGDLHIGHWYNFAPADILARFERMNGAEVLNPIGFDAFGLPAENAAIKRNIHPADWTNANINSMLKQLEKMGPSYDWDRVIITSDPQYYKWTQWCFLKLYEKGLAHKAKAAANWCPVCKSVLANEQAEGGVCWRCGSQVEQKMIEQWFFKITDYAQRLLDDLDNIDWPEKIKLMQKNWIGKSEGAEIYFTAEKPSGETGEIPIFTTRPETIFGATALILAPEHELVEELTTLKQKREVNTYIENTKYKTERERIADTKKKTGVFLGSYAINPMTHSKIPIWIADFVLATYGTGAIMAVPAHDKRDYDFAKQHDIPIKFVLQPAEVTALITINTVESEYFNELKKRGFPTTQFSSWGIIVHCTKEQAEDFQKLTQYFLKEGPNCVYIDGMVRVVIFKDKIIPYNPNGTGWDEAKAYAATKKIIPEKIDLTFPEEGFENCYTETENAVLVDSENFSGLRADEAKKEIISYLEKQGKAKTVNKFRIRDWLVSRQRYWGAPVPIIYCPRCGTVPVPEKDLPVLLPYDVDYTPQETSPLGSSEVFVNTVCPECGEKAKRDTDTLDTFVDSSWYFLRYPTPTDDTKPFASKALGAEKNKEEDDEDIVNTWLPVDTYIGGAEHAVLHLLYARFFTKFFYDQGYVQCNEPFQRLYNQGTILGPDGQKMSKSKGNVINPDELVEHYGADTVRVYLAFLGPYDQGGAWNPAGIEGAARFVRKVYTLMTDRIAIEPDQAIEIALNKLIKKITHDIPKFKFNTSIAACMEFINKVGRKALTRDQKERLLKILAPFCPFLTEEIWHTTLNHKDSIHTQQWPKWDETLLVESIIEIPIQINGKLRDCIKISAGATEEEVYEKAIQSEKIKKFIANENNVQKIFIPDKLLNIVTVQ